MQRGYHRALPTRTLSLAAALAAVVAVSIAPRAAADEPRCDGFHSLADPLPDACLGVIDTDRPHQTDTPHVVAAGHTQIESALVAVPLGGTLDAPPGQRGAHVAFFENDYKFGLVSRTDLQLMIRHAYYDVARSKLEPPGPFAVRVKINVVEEDGAIPALTLVPWVVVPVAPSQGFRGGPYVFWGWELPARLELEMNAGLLFAGDRASPAPVVATALTWTVAGEARVFADVYATGSDWQLGTGALWAITRDLQLDLGSYVGLAGATTVATPFLGLSVRR